MVLADTCLAAGALSTCAVDGLVYFFPFTLSTGLLTGFETAACSLLIGAELL